MRCRKCSAVCRRVLNANIAYDATEFINESIWEVGKTLGEAGLIVIVVIFLFLGNLRSTFIPVVTIPLSLVGVALVLVAFGYSINLLTLLALVLAIGLVVDDAIVVVENIHRHIEEGMTPFDAAIKGAREITGPVIAMTITLAAVYAPIGFTSGLTGALFREFAFTLAGAVIVSGVIALTLSPMMTSKMLKPHDKEGWFGRLVERVFGSVQRFYRRRLDGTIKQRSVFAWVAVLTVVLSGVLYNAINRELAPAEDQGVLFAFINAPEHTNLDYLTTYTDQLTGIFMDVPERQNLFAINGFPTSHGAFMGLILKPWGERERSDLSVMGELQGKFMGVAGVNAFATAPSAIPVGAGEMPVEFVITYPGDYTQLASTLDAIDAEAKKSGLFIFTNADLRFSTPQAELIVDKDRANKLGVTMQDVGATLATLLGGNNVNRFAVQGRSYQVIPQVPRGERATTEQILKYHVRATNGDMVPLSSFISLGQSVQPNSLKTFQQLNSATLQGVPFPGRTVGEAVTFLQQKASEMFPQGMAYDFKGESRQFVTGRQYACRHVRLLAVADLSGAGGAVRKLPRPFHHSCRLAGHGVRRAVRVVDSRQCQRHDAEQSAVQHRLRHHQHLYADRPRDADRPHRQARHFDGGIRQQAAGNARDGQEQRHQGSRSRALAAHPDDHGRHGDRRGAAAHCRWRRRQKPLRYRRRDCRRHDHRHHVHPVHHARDLFLRGARPPWQGSSHGSSG